MEVSSNLTINFPASGPDVYVSFISIPPFGSSTSTNLVLYPEYTAASNSFISCIANLLPTHIRPPLPKAQNQRCISVVLSSAVVSVVPAVSPSLEVEEEVEEEEEEEEVIQRSGSQRSGEGKMAGLRCRL